MDMSYRTYREQINDPANHAAHYFAAGNTENGFVSSFESVFDRRGLDRIYILKGGPGVGKSTLMTKTALNAERRGKEVLYYHCSSDPASLDGILIPEEGMAVVDGTAPHVFDPVCAGVKEIIVDLGAAWDLNALAVHREEILRLSEKKQAEYRRAYRYFKAAGALRQERRSLSEDCLLREKMKAAAARFFASRIGKPLCTGESNETVNLLSANSRDGRVRFFTPEKQAETLVFIKDAKGTAAAFLEELRKRALSGGVPFCRGADALEQTETECLYFPEKKVCVSLYDDNFCCALDRAHKAYGILNMSRFLDREAFRGVRTRYRFAAQCEKELLAEGYASLAAAGDYHASIEKLYGEATDYGRVQKVVLK